MTHSVIRGVYRRLPSQLQSALRGARSAVRADPTTRARSERTSTPKGPASNAVGEIRIDPSTGLESGEVEARAKELRAKRTFGSDDLSRLRSLLADADEVVTVREAHARREDWPERFIALRHDMEHDVENAVKFAEWEASLGLKASYYALQGDWYWRSPSEPSTYLLRALDRIASLGHEVGLHNNVVSVALRTGEDPFVILDKALTALRRRGFDIAGTAAHGDPVCRTAGFVNSEIFTELPRPERGAADRTLTYLDPSGQVSTLQLQPRSMAEFGLTYEANFIGQSQGLSDADGRWSHPFREAEEMFRNGGFLAVLVHPVWWALGDEGYTPKPPDSKAWSALMGSADAIRAARRDTEAKEVRIIVRGDCCSRRAIDLNKDLFGGNPVMIRDEKARTDFLLEHSTVGSPSPDDIRGYLDTDQMSTSLRAYAIGQTERNTLAAENPRLLVMDNYADMNFAAWRHRRMGWKLWIHPKYLRDAERFHRDFEHVDELSFDESLEAHASLIERYRELYGPIPVLYFHQPIAYYRKLQRRAEFRRLGPELEARIPGVFAADIHDSDLVPDDMGSCGPGQTLHFSGPTYRKMILAALERGAEWLESPAVAAS